MASIPFGTDMQFLLICRVSALVLTPCKKTGALKNQKLSDNNCP
jgi:hypothetical protein